jgi:hypothetical protein
MGHNWSGWPGAYCLRCGAGHVLEIAVAENWFDQDPETGVETWKSDDHRELVRLCDDYCYDDMTHEEAEAHKAKIRVLQDKAVGWLSSVRVERVSSDEKKGG